MAIVTDKAVNIVEHFIKLAKDSGINIERAILFGSYAKGVANKWSDIDIAIVSPNFSGISFYDREMFISSILKTDSSIEVHPFRPEDFTEEDLFVKEIIENGVELKV